MKTFQQFSEDMRELENTMKGFANTIVPQLKQTAERNKKSPKELDALRRRASKIVRPVDPPKLGLVITQEGDATPTVGPYDLWIEIENKKT